ncbi:Hypothetical protein R9X50_00131800 [Acrodontium crateriforme]|uniref:Ataxin-10 homolog n=1 Tax=Acrodontium crateriforme TaxID=150365 RepID=A0AAQ3R9Z5_9PEZI|nr:Hypothetical protein R9X50_00131800 [Acrodontium crateriforme]
MARDWFANSERKRKAHSVFVRLLLPPYTIHFKSPTYMRESTLELLDRKVCKETLKSTAQDASVREAIGTDARFWMELVTLLRAAIPSLERRSFSIWDPSGIDYESTSGALIASHYPALWKDLERLNDLISISRNVLTLGEAAQDLAAEQGADNEIFRLINCCVRVTARGYDGEAGTGDEEKWQWIVNAYKKLLITCLQFLNNLAAQNERRKLMLWVSLFDHASSAGDAVLGQADYLTDETLTGTPTRPDPPLTTRDLLLTYGTNGPDGATGTETIEISGTEQPLWDDEPFSKWPFPSELQEDRAKLRGNGYCLFAKTMREFQIEDYNIERERDPTAAEMFLEMPRRWYELHEEDQSFWNNKFAAAQKRFERDMRVWEARVGEGEAKAIQTKEEEAAVQEEVGALERKIRRLEEQIAERYRIEGGQTVPGSTASMSSAMKLPAIAPLEPPSYAEDGSLIFSSGPEVEDEDDELRPTGADDMRMLFTADAGAIILEAGKAELMKRLEGYGTASLKPGLAPAEVAGVAEGSSSAPPSAPAQTPAESPTTKRRQLIFTQTSEDVGDGSERPEDHVYDAEYGSESDLPPDSVEDGEDEEDDEEEDYPGSTEDGRGLLTDVPLILGPSEIEVLPMLIMSGIVPSPSLTNSLQNPEESVRTAQESAEAQANAMLNMHTVRTHLLLSQSNGRNLLRELLIFVAAWDLREEELYFKFMVKIMEAILKGGLMPYAYHAFRDRSRSKDIISPAQAVIMKLLTCIFRARSESNKQSAAAAASATAKSGQDNRPQVFSGVPSSPPSKVDLHILNFIFTEFRQHIIPQTCALIFLQGQIHLGRASPEDFPLNLWDMERMYEGVYQYLEFFAVLSEDSAWKEILATWEMASELVTLLRELEGGISRPGQSAAAMKRMAQAAPQQQQAGRQRSMSADAAVGHDAKVLPMDHPFEAQGTTTQHVQQTSGDFHQEGNAVSSALGTARPPVPDQDEPSAFEWRNLKKLTVLVLSSLVWKNRPVQDQVRKYGGLEALVACCRHDEHNPYIREHAIMCLRFAVEGCKENGEVVRGMAGGLKAGNLASPANAAGGYVKEAIVHRPKDANVPATKEAEILGKALGIPREVLDTQGYETFMDAKGQVGLRSKGGLPVIPNMPSAASIAAAITGATAAGSVTAAGVANNKPSAPRLGGTAKMTAEKAAELMQNALRDLPLGDKPVTDRQKAEALAKLDKAFETTERALGRQGKQPPSGPTPPPPPPPAPSGSASGTADLAMKKLSEELPLGNDEQDDDEAETAALEARIAKDTLTHEGSEKRAQANKRKKGKARGR